MTVGQTGGVRDEPEPPVDATTAAIGSVLFAAVLFGTAGTARELGPDTATSLSVGAVRIVVGTVVLWAVVTVLARRNGEPVLPEAVLSRHGPRILLGGLGVVAYTPLFFVAVDRAGVAVGTIVTISSGPFFAGAIEWTVRRTPPRGGWFAGTTITVIGAGLLVLGARPGDAGIEPIGVAAALCAGLGYAVYSVTSKSTMQRGLPSTLALAAPFSVGAVGVVVLASRESYEWLGDDGGLAMGLYLGVVATGAAYVLFGFGLRRLTSATTVTLVLAEPVTAALLATVVLHETIPPMGWFGVVVVVAGLWLVGRSEVEQDLRVQLGVDVSTEPVQQ